VLDRNLLHKQEVTADAELRIVYRFVHFADPQDPAAIEDFRSDAEKKKKPRGRSARIPELQSGLSFFKTRELALSRWKDIAAVARKRDPGASPQIGSHLATVLLKPSSETYYEDLGQQDGHVTIWGKPETLAAGIIELIQLEG
jgi:hypothetical protein